MTYARYAIYLTPPAGPLRDFGSAWLGWDIHCKQRTEPPMPPDLPLSLSEVTCGPHKYGFHGTMKPPFRLAPETTEKDLCHAFKRFCDLQTRFDIVGLELVQLGRFLALIPVGPIAHLNTLARQVVQHFDPFRAALTDAERARRTPKRLSAAQCALLERWGYPYVMEEFRFHFTLTAKLPKRQATAVYAQLKPILAPILPKPFSINALSLVGEGKDGRFEVLQTHEFPG